MPTSHENVSLLERHLQEIAMHFAPSTLVGAIVYLILFLFIGFVLSWLIRVGIRRLLAYDKDERIDRLSAVFIMQMARAAVWIVVLMMYAHTVPALNQIGVALLAGVSVASIVVGMAAQATLGNLIAGIGLIFYRPFRVGDRMQVNTPGGLETATVENVTLGYTILKTDDDRRIVLSNSNIANQVMINLPSVDR